MNASAQCIEASQEPQQRVCPTCASVFTPRSSWGRFCSTRCRNAYHAEHGHTGKVKSVRRLKRGWSVTVWMDDAASLELGTAVRLAREP